MKKLTLSLLLLIFVSCVSNIRNANVPNFDYVRSDFTFGAAKDVTITLEPLEDGGWVTETGAKVTNSEDLETVLEAVYPDADAFIYGKVTKQQNIKSLPLPMLPVPIILSSETVYDVRALQIGTHK
jgi:hypothetical protein